MKPSDAAVQGDRRIGQSSTQQVLVIKPSSLGDVVHTLPAVAILRRKFPDACLSWLVNTEWMPLLEGNPHVDEVIEFPRREFRGLRGWLRIVPWLRQLRARVQADFVFDFQGLLRSALIAWIARAKGGRILGLEDAREGARYFYDSITSLMPRQHAVARYMELALSLTERGCPRILPRPEWNLPPGSAPAGFTLLEPFVLLHPFSRGKGKSLSPEDIRTFCEVLAPISIIVAGRADRQAPALSHVTDLLNRTTLTELIWLIRRAHFVVSVDSGPMHIAAAITGDLLSIHTWSDPQLVGPYRDDAWIWKNGAISRVCEKDNRRSAPDIRAIAEWVKARVRVS